MYELPTTIELENGHHLNIRNQGDFRMVLDCFNALTDADINREERIYACMIIFYKDLMGLEDIESFFDDSTFRDAVEKMFDFFNCGEEQIGYKANKNLINWRKDEQMIMSGINKVAGKEVRAEKYMHWYTFVSYYMAIGDGVLSTVVSIRDKLVRGKKLEKSEKEFYKENPSYFNWQMKSAEEIRMEKEIDELWNSGK